MFREDLEFVLTDAGENATVSLNGVSTNCIYAEKSADALGAGRSHPSIGVEKTATIQTGSLPGLAIGSRVTLNAPARELFNVQCDVRNYEAVDEGAMTRLYLSNV